MDVNLLNVLQSGNDNQLALVSARQSLSYAELTAAVSTLSAWLADTSVKVLALKADNSVAWVVVDLACQLADIVCIPIPDFFSESQICHCLNESGAELLISDDPHYGRAIKNGARWSSLPTFPLSSCSASAPVSPVFFCWRSEGNESARIAIGNYPENTQKITFTSGSTGNPKGVCLSQQHQWRVAVSLATGISLHQPRHLCLLPLSTLLENIAGIYGPLFCGGTIVIADSKERGLSGSSGLNAQTLLSCITNNKPDSIILLPQLLSVLVAACQQGWPPPDSLKFVAVGGARVSPQLLQSAHDAGLPAYQGYGLSECGSVVALNTPDEANFFAVGKPLPHTNITIEKGEIVVTGEVFLGYLGQPESWYPERVHSGDIGTFEDDFLQVSGRSKNVVISSFGRNISPEWIETELLSTLIISHCLVAGDDQPHLGVLLSAPEQVGNGEIQNWISQVNDSLPDYARVKTWQRLKAQDWKELITANGRLRRQQALTKFNDRIVRLWNQSADVSAIS